MGLAPSGGLAAPGRLTWAHVDVQLVTEAYERVVVAAAVMSALAPIDAQGRRDHRHDHAEFARWHGILADRLDTLGTVLACELRPMPGAGAPARDVHPAEPALPVGASDGGTYGAGGHCGAVSADDALTCTRCDRSIAELRAEVAREASLPAGRRLRYPTAFCNEQCPAAVLRALGRGGVR